MAEHEQGQFSYASQAQILRAHQRDSSQIARLTDLVSELVRSAFGTRALNSAHTPLTASVGALYYLLTFGLGSQTLGEEYVDIQPYAEATRNFPSRTRRLLSLIFFIAPTILYSHATRYLSSPRVRKLLTILPALHLALFMLRGRYHSLSKRLAGITYISTDRSSRTIPSYEPLGILLLIPLVSSLLSLASSESTCSTSETAIPEIETNSVNPSVLAPTESPQMCTLCLDPRGTHAGTALTECGHGFCWGCLAGLEKMECPLCRQTLRMERLISVRNL